MSERKKSQDLESLGEIFSRLGFEKGARSSTKAAFVRYLVKEAYGLDSKPPEIYAEIATKPSAAPAKNSLEQLSFFDKDESA